MQYAKLTLAFFGAFAATSMTRANSLDDMSLEELVKTDVTSVSRKSQSLTDVPAAAFVISAEDIRRSGVQSLPDVLRMAPGIEVAQIDNGRYAVTARGFNGRFATKLQVLIDGRSIYSPLFAGVLWELDPIPLDDIERIEIIRGPGAVMWGANAVNGLINIISKHTRNQNAGAVNVTAGTKGTGVVYARIGQSSDADTSWKLSAQARQMDPSRRGDGTGDSVDTYDSSLVDFRLDHDLGSGSDLSVWANANRSKVSDQWSVVPDFTTPTVSLSNLYPDQVLYSESLVGRYRWLSDGGVESTVQSSFSHSGIDITRFISEHRNTFDLDYQSRYATGHHDILWGLNYRTSTDEIKTNAPYIVMNGETYTQTNLGVFLQDDWTLLQDTLKLGAGVRADETSRNGTNLSTQATLLWTPTRRDSAWIKYAQAPRTSARAERDISILTGLSVHQVPNPYLPGTTFNLPVITYATDNRNLGTEKARGFEIGYRKQFSNALNADISAYRYRYTDLRTGLMTATFNCMNPGDAAQCAYFGITPGTPLVLAQMQTVNGMSAWNNGVELSVEWMVLPNWRLQLSYNWTNLNVDGSPIASFDANAKLHERANPRHTGSLRSQWNISTNQQFDIWIRGASGFYREKLIDVTPSTSSEPAVNHVSGYVTADLRYAYRVNKALELALIGRNLIGSKRVEYYSDFIPTAATEITPTWLLNTRWSF